MADYFSQFSDSFLVAVMAWPLVALLLTLPILLVQYIRYHRLPVGRVAVIYLFVFYALGLVAFALYPLPDDPSAYCVAHHLSPQLNPLQFIADIQSDGVRAILQLGMNVAFFVPLGIILRNLAGLKLLPSIAIALATSLCIEFAQLTGAFGIFPCSYRLFDVCDLAMNTLGAALGFLVAVILPNFSHTDKRTEINTRPSLLQRLVILVSDQLAIYIVTVLITAPVIYFSDLSMSAINEIHSITFALIFILAQFLLPLCFSGQTLFARLTGVSLDDKERAFVRRLLYYIARLAFLYFVLVKTDTIAYPVLVIAAIFTYIFARKLPYVFVDLFFSSTKKPKAKVKSKSKPKSKSKSRKSKSR